MLEHRYASPAPPLAGTGPIDGRLRPANPVKRVWAFIIDQFLVGALVACVWAPLVLAVGSPLRFEPLLPIIEPQTDCRLVDEVDTRTLDGAETSVREHICTITYFERWKGYEYVRDQQTVSGGIRYTSTTYYPTDQEGNPIWVIDDGLITALVLLIYFTLLEGTASGRTVGKFVLGLKVVGEEGAAMTKGRAFVRNLVKLLPVVVLYTASAWNVPLAAMLQTSVSSALEVVGLTVVLVMFVGFALVFLTPARQAFHDLLSSTEVRSTA